MADKKANSKAALVDELNGLLADHFALFIKTKNFHWHVKGPRFHDLHLLFDTQALEVRDQIDLIAERVRKLQGHFGQAAKDIDDILVSSSKVVKRGQKIEALVSRSVTQARDVFDLHLLLASGADMAPVHQMEAVMREDAQAKAMSITFDQFKGQVLAYLAPEWQAQYGSAEVWDGLVLGVVEALGGGHETR